MWIFKDLLKGSSQKGLLSKQIRHTIRAAKQSCDFLEAFVYSGHYILYLLLGFFVCLFVCFFIPDVCKLHKVEFASFTTGSSGPTILSGTYWVFNFK